MNGATFVRWLAPLALLAAASCCEPLPPKTPQAPVVPVVAPLPPVVRRVLPALVVLREPDSKTVSFRFVFRAGSADDPADKKGISLLTAKLVTEGGTESLSYSELLDRLFPMAAELGAYVERDQTTIFGRVHVDHLEAYWSILRDVLVKPRLAEPDFARIRDQQTSELTQSLRGSDDEELGKAALQSLMYEGHPYGAPVAGTASGLGAISLTDLKAHRDSTMCAARLTVGLVGAVPEGFEARVTSELEGLPQACAERAELTEPARPPSMRVLLVDKPSAESTAISIGFPIGVRRGDPDYAALKLVEAYFGQHRAFIGVLQQSLRVQRGLNYGNYAYVEHFEQEASERIPAVNIARRQQYFSIWLRPVKDADKHFALRLALFELGRLVDKGLTQEELENTRRFIKRYYGNFAQTESRRLGYAIDDKFYGLDKPYFEGLFEALDKLKLEQVNEAIRKHLTKDKLFVAMVTKNAEQLAVALGDDAPSAVTYTSAKPEVVAAEDKQVNSLRLGIAKEAIQILDYRKIFE